MAAPEAHGWPQPIDIARKMSGPRQPAPFLALQVVCTACPQKAPPALWVKAGFSTAESSIQALCVPEKVTDRYLNGDLYSP
jgi:hypothetical protein